MQLRVLSGTDVRTYSCEGGENLLTFLQGKGYAIAASCGGNGKCGKCKVRVLEGGVEGQENGYAYACLAHISRDAYVEVFETKGSGLTRSFVQDSKTDGEGGEDDTTESGFPQIVQDGEYHTLACAFRKVGP